MKMHRIKDETVLLAPIDQVWEFFTHTPNLSLLTPPEMQLRFRNSNPEPLHKGQVLDYTIKPIAGIPLNWTTEIKEVQPMDFFIDIQTRGPYAFWEHKHTFKSEGSKTSMTDSVTYALPFSPLSDYLVHRIVRKKLEYLFQYRKQQYHQLWP